MLLGINRQKKTKKKNETVLTSDVTFIWVRQTFEI